MNEDNAVDFMDTIEDLLEQYQPKNSELTKMCFQTHDDYDGIPEGKVWIEAKTSTSYFDEKKTREGRCINRYI